MARRLELNVGTVPDDWGGKAPEDTDWHEIDLLYSLLEQMQPSPVVTLNRAVAVAKVRGPEAALAMIEPLESAVRLLSLLGLKGGLLMQLGRGEEARVAFDRAIALANTAAEAAHIRMHIDRLMKDGAASRRLRPRGLTGSHWLSRAWTRAGTTICVPETVGYADDENATRDR